MTRWPRKEDSETWFPSASGRVKSGAGSPGARRLSVMELSGDERDQGPEGTAAVADRVLVFRGHLGGGLGEPVGQEDRGVAEPAGAAAYADQPPCHLAGDDLLAG